jgi:hypothetical protein
LFVTDGKALKIAFDGTTTGEGSCAWYMPGCFRGNVAAEILWAQEIEQHYIYLIVSAQHDGAAHYGKITYDRADGTLSYLNSAGASVEFASGLVVWDYSYFVNNWKLVVDSVSDEYVRFIANTKSYDLSGIDLRATVAAAPDNFYVKVGCANNTLQEADFWLDRAIFTQNEPSQTEP